MKRVEDKKPFAGGSSPEGSRRPEYLNYFGKDRIFQQWFAEKRTRLTAAIFPPLARLGVAPDTISYVGIAFLAGVVLYFVRDPATAILFLAAHVICDGLDGAYARNMGKASQSGAFTDLVCDQLGMIVVAALALFHHLAPALLGAIYISLYLIVVVFGVIINAMGLGTRITITSKYILYTVYAVWAITGRNLIPLMMSVFSLIMAAEVVVGYLRLKRGIRKKYDSEIRFSGADPYSGRLNYALNVAVPLMTLILIVVFANRVVIRALFTGPTLSVSWKELAPPVSIGPDETLLGVGSYRNNLVVIGRTEDGEVQFRETSFDTAATLRSFIFPSHFEPAFGDLPVDGSTLLVVDNATRLLLGIDLEASFSAGRAIIALTLPLGTLRVTAMAVTVMDGRKRWLAANYLYTRRTYLVDPEEALKKGALPAGVVASYINCGFPSGMTVTGDYLFELNDSPFGRLIFTSSLRKALDKGSLIDTAKASFRPPPDLAFGPLVHGEFLIGVSRTGRPVGILLNTLFP
jgi:phosphatidylglycerophosphate synthase